MSLKEFGKKVFNEVAKEGEKQYQSEKAQANQYYAQQSASKCMEEYQNGNYGKAAWEGLKILAHSCEQAKAEERIEKLNNSDVGEYPEDD